VVIVAAIVTPASENMMVFNMHLLERNIRKFGYERFPIPETTRH
jgi:hypothetical protein